MYQVYAFATPNSIKVLIGLEELNLEYELIPVNVRKGEQKAADHLARNPNGKVPVLIDDGLPAGDGTLTESAAILVYLAEHHGKLLPAIGMARARVFEQLFFHASGIGASIRPGRVLPEECKRATAVGNRQVPERGKSHRCSARPSAGSPPVRRRRRLHHC